MSQEGFEAIKARVHMIFLSLGLDIRLPPASQALIAFPDAILGLTPQALC
jgi:hypothetical protein